MFDLGLNTFAEEEYSSDGIFIIDSEPTYEQLLEINNELYRELYFMKYAQFEKEVQDGFDMFSNAFVACEYVQQNGFDEHVAQLIGNEGLITNIKDVVVKFAKWLMSIIRKVVQWVTSLFTKSTISYDKSSSLNARKITYSLIRGDRSSRDKAVADIKQISSKLSENRSESKTDSYIEIPDDFREEAANIGALPNMLSALLDKGSDRLDFDLIKMISKQTTFTFSKTTERVRVHVAADSVLRYSDALTKTRTAVMFLYNKLKTIPSLSENPTAEECNKYIQQVSKVLNLPFKQYNEKYSNNAKVMQLRVQNMFKVFKGVYVIEAKLIKAIFPIINDIVSLGGAVVKNSEFIDGNTDKFHIGTYAVDYRTRIPKDLMDRIRKAWKDDKLTINRLIISSVRKPVLDGTDGLSYGSRIHGSSKDVFISYQSFKNKLALKQDVEKYIECFKNKGLDPSEYHIQIDTDRVKQLLNVIVHECRHVYQYSNKKHLKDSDKIGSKDETHIKYLKYEHEMDARKAALNFEFKQEDVDWVKSILKNICKQIIETNRKRRSEKKSK